MGTAVWRTQGRQDSFDIAINGVLVWRESGWIPPLSGPGIPLGTIASPKNDVRAVSRTSDSLDVFVVGFDGAVWSIFWTAAQGWDAGGLFRVSPSGMFNSETQIVSVVSRTVDNIDLFAIDFNGVVRSTSWTSAGGWSTAGWIPINAGTTFDPSSQRVYARSRTSDAIELYVLGPDMSVFGWTSWSEAGGWDPSGWMIVGPQRPVLTKEVAVVSRTLDTLDLFAMDINGAIWWTTWNQTVGWNRDGWFELAPADFLDVDSNSVSAVARQADTLDLFAIRSDNSVWWTSWSMASGWAANWSRIGTASNFNHTTQKVVAISAFPNSLDLFVIGDDKRVWSTFWTVVEGWRPQGWFRVPGPFGVDPTTQQVSVVSRTPDTLDLFAIGLDDVVWSTFRSEANGWAGSWFPVASGASFDPFTNELTAISRAPDKLDLFISGTDSIVWSTYWSAANGWLGEWFPLGIPGSSDEPISRVSAVARTPDTMDLFVVASGGPYSKHFDDAAGGWNFEDWFAMYPGQTYVGMNSSAVDEVSLSAISRSENDIDVFVVGASLAAGLPGCASTFWTATQGRWSPGGWFPIIPASVYEPTS